MTDLEINVELAQANDLSLTFEKASKYLSYDSQTGDFIWKLNSGRYGRILAGSKAGSLHKASGYWRISIDGKKYKAHRIAWLLHNGEHCNQFIDHINGVRSDNRIENLRTVTVQENGMNSRTPERNRSGHKGVTWNKNAQKWHAYITFKLKRINLGLFLDVNHAVAKRKNAESALFGSFVRL